MDFIKRLSFWVITAILCCGFVACKEEAPPKGDDVASYTHSSILFTYEYSGTVYDLVDLSYEVIFDAETEEVAYDVAENVGQINISFSEVMPLSTISVKIVATRNDEPIDMAEGIAYDRRDTPRFYITRYYDDGTSESGGEIHSGSTNATGLDKTTLNEYIADTGVKLFTVSLDEEGKLLRNKE